MSQSKRVGIVTFQWFNNYGTVLQAYALQTALKQLGYRAEIVPILCDQLRGWKRFLSKTPQGVWIKIKLFMWERGNCRRNMYDAFRRRYFDYGNVEPMSFSEMAQTELPYDVMVWGSDNIWGPWCVCLDDAPMAGVFFGTAIRHQRKIAYAASTGAHLELHPEYREAVARIKSAGFERIGLREAANVKVFADQGLWATHVPDPSLLLTAQDWARVEDASHCPHEPYVLGYELGHVGSLTVREGCELVSRERNLLVRMPYPKAFWKDRDVACYPTPLEWVALFHHAECVVTDSFHGVMFSLIFRKPFVFIPAQDEKGIPNMRVNEILKYVGLESRILSSAASKGFVTSLMSTPIAWDDVYEVLTSLRLRGVDFLRAI